MFTYLNIYVHFHEKSAKRRFHIIDDNVCTDIIVKNTNKRIFGSKFLLSVLIIRLCNIK